MVFGLEQPRGLEADTERIYWADRGSQSVRVRPISGGGVLTLASGFTFIQDVALAPADGLIYVVDSSPQGPGALYSVPIGGGPKTLITSALANPKHLVLTP